MSGMPNMARLLALPTLFSFKANLSISGFRITAGVIEAVGKIVDVSFIVGVFVSSIEMVGDAVGNTPPAEEEAQAETKMESKRI